MHGHLGSGVVAAVRGFVGVSGALILLASVATAVSGFGRLAYSLGEHGMLPRRFGRLLLGTEAGLREARAMPKLGPEPIDPDFTGDALYQALRRRRAPLKAVLLDQKALAGVGNIYADESLHRARLRPDRIAEGVSRKSARRLHESLRESLETAIRNRGSSVDTYRDAWGEVGGQQEVLLVYGRAGQPCFTCGRPLSAVRIAGRTTVFCRRCQH